MCAPVKEVTVRVVCCCSSWKFSSVRMGALDSERKLHDDTNRNQSIYLRSFSKNPGNDYGGTSTSTTYIYKTRGTGRPN